MANWARTDFEPIPGYRLRRRLGAGGYGEVWSAEAPGQLSKAIKIIDGRRGEQWLDREWSALNRVRKVRHPFLLSLERIERVEGHLLIVTELAEGSLKDCFDQHRRAGRCGIPRDALLGYLVDAADVLDHLADRHGLQHLDVKPENLLLLADRVKLADFGLVQPFDVATALCPRESAPWTATASRDERVVLDLVADDGGPTISATYGPVWGLTPAYASPEVFAGAPNRHSDQYSLAIVYQMLLTGTGPFAGGTLSELAQQHFTATPQLSGIPPIEQEILRRALSKDPAQRFPSCRRLVEELMALPSDSDVVNSPSTPTERLAESTWESATEVLLPGRLPAMPIVC